MLGGYRKIYWTEHAKIKMRQYGLSKSKLMNLMYRRQGKEVGIVEGTMALMQPVKSYSSVAGKRPSGEIWLMYKDVKQERKIISVWRYPGISKPGEMIPIPDDIAEFLKNNG